MISLIAALAISQSSPPRSVTFTYASDTKLNSVAVVGEFNGWDRGSNPLKLQADGKTWVTKVEIKPGVYQYLFCLNGSEWVPDPTARFVNNNGNKNSLITVQPPSYDLQPGVEGDGYITADALKHVPDRTDTVRLTKDVAHVKFRTRMSDVAKVNVVTVDGLEVKFWPMHKISSDGLYDTWQGKFKIPAAEVTEYGFNLLDGHTTAFFGPKGLGKDPLEGGWFRQDLRAYPLPTAVPWVENSVFYQIFPDRFFDGDPSNNGPNAQPWGTKPTGDNRMGGDLKGITAKMGYLHGLGISALYLNPIFVSGSNHGYNTYDYHTVDPRFGTNDDLKDLVKNAHLNGIKVILDGVFNHSGTKFFAFQDLLKNQEASKYKDWFFVLKSPVKVGARPRTYQTFADVQSMPKLNTDNPELATYLEDVGTRWIKFADIDGWRLDAADEVSQAFWRKYRKAIKTAKPDAFIMGEEWGDAHEWLQGDEHDSVMNYPWRKAVLDFFSIDDQTPAAFESELQKVRDLYSPVLVNSMFNLLGSHDTERVATILKPHPGRLAQAVVFQFTYPGTPSVYYGDEIGMEGGKDPDDRRCMIWDESKWNTSLLSLYKQLIALRNASAALRQGRYQMVGAPPNVFAFKRTQGEEVVTVFVHKGSGYASCHLPGGDMKIAFHAELQGPTVSLGPDGYAVFRSGN
ncbi:MAG TPA: alpha amylase N-terminal ig-like domain-containing protein [Fimbriimonadaceae bacterium]|jgi:glycosidase